MTRTVILVSWDGRTPPLACIDVDAAPDFDVILFDYSGEAATPSAPMPLRAVMRQRTECKGQIYEALAAYLATSEAAIDSDYVALIDDDIHVTVSALNGAIALAHAEGLDSFALSLTSDSYVNHQRFVQRPGGDIRPMPWVEVMMPFYRRSLFLAAAPFFKGSVSSYGIDQFVMPTICALTDASRVAIIDRFSARHARPVTSDGRVYANGLTAHQERIRLRRKCLSHLHAVASERIGTRWYYQTFAPLDGPGRFWPLRLLWPWHQLRRLLAPAVSANATSSVVMPTS
jgi:hypothetical protein